MMKQQLFEHALKAQKNSHSPYSHYAVGAAVLSEDGKIYSGCNVENASYGGTVCAERIAIFKAVSEGAAKKFTQVCVVTSGDKVAPPCGFCLQVMSEFCTPDTEVHLAHSARGIQRSLSFAELLPHSFSPDFLK